ncbi:MAG: hypothetical protein LKE33_07590 [Acidaminococcus sp.]|nr:hypothetical protein [Acidaminococcus sp.]MCI2100813.1 hypothetical protein [Acidaminococcus sp.]MCI2115141.1 hypothetical protein [Acidaminococcus sp.]MCI2117217.1 hypothetical protein [Acidaminococcus sp.]
MKRKYKRVLFHSAGKTVMFEMENGWFYNVDMRQHKIFVFWLPDFCIKFNPYVEDDVPEDVKQKAIKLLDVLPLETAMIGRLYERKYGRKYIEGTPNLDRIDARKKGLLKPGF